MSLYRIGVLISKEFRHGAGNLFFILAFVYPIALSLIVTLVFGDVLEQKPRIGILDNGNSEFALVLEDQARLDIRSYDDIGALRDATEEGIINYGVVIPVNFDEALQNGTAVDLTRYVWSETEGDDQLKIESALQQGMVSVSGSQMPVVMEGIQLGDEDTSTWTERLMPLLVIMTIMMGGILLPASALVEEKSNRTLLGLTVTPTTLLEVYVAKATIGVIISSAMGVMVLVINNAFGNDPVLLVGLLALGSIAGSLLGVILGSYIKSVEGLLAVIKGLGIVLAMPAILAIFPEVPEWIQQIFPTHYILDPVIKVSQEGANFGDVVVEVGVLLALVGAMVIFLVMVFERQQKRLALDH